MNEESIAAGAARRTKAQGPRAEQLQSYLCGLDAGVGEWADRFVFDDVWGRPGLEFEDRMIVAITALAAGRNFALLGNYMHGGLEAGIDPRKIHEALVMLTVYCGFPVSIQALQEWKRVVDSARRRGMDVPELVDR